MFDGSGPARRGVGVLALAVLAGCGISKQYVGANAKTILDSAEMTKKSLATCLANDSCAAIAVHLNADLEQIVERAKAMCARAGVECEAAP